MSDGKKCQPHNDSCQVATLVAVSFHAWVPRGQQIHRKWVWLNWHNVLPSWGRVQNGDAMDEPWVQMTPNSLRTSPKFYLQHFVRI